MAASGGSSLVPQKLVFLLLLYCAELKEEFALRLGAADRQIAQLQVLTAAAAGVGARLHGSPA